MTKADFTSPRLAWFHTAICVHYFDSYSLAADFFKCNQSSVTRQVEYLERWFGKEIFHNTKPPRITDFGEMVLGTARMHLVQMYELRDFRNYKVNKKSDLYNEDKVFRQLLGWDKKGFQARLKVGKIEF